MIEWYVNNAIVKIAEERKRIEKFKKRKDWEENSKRQWAWMVNFLAKTDEELLAEGRECERCKMCDVEQKTWLECEFSFCEEYGCGMVLCKSCAEKIGKLSEVIK